jgi:hypothetical protein
VFGPAGDATANPTSFDNEWQRRLRAAFIASGGYTRPPGFS